MHSLTLLTKYTFGDRVRFNSRMQSCSGTGRIFAITIDEDRKIDYMIEIDLEEVSDIHMQPGILEDEITYLEKEV